MADCAAPWTGVGGGGGGAVAGGAVGVVVGGGVIVEAVGVVSGIACP